MSTITIIQGNSNDKDNTRAYMVKGKDGVSPTIDLEESTGKVTISVTDYKGTEETTISDPIVSVTKNDGVATISVTDKDGTRTTTIADGADLTDGAMPTGAVIDFDGQNLPAGYEEVNNERTDFMWSNMSGDITTNTTAYSNISNWQELQKKGSSLSIDNGVIKVNKSGKVKITVKFLIYNNTASRQFFYSNIIKNANAVSSTWLIQSVDSNCYATINNQSICEVDVNDTLTVDVYGDNIDVKGEQTTISVERIV